MNRTQCCPVCFVIMSIQSHAKLLSVNAVLNSYIFIDK